MDTRLIDVNGVVVVEECPFPKPGETIQHPTLPALAYRQAKGYVPELRLLDIGSGMLKKWYHIVTVEQLPSDQQAPEGCARAPAIKEGSADLKPIRHKVGY